MSPSFRCADFDDSARHMLASVVTPLLETISKVTGLGHLTLLCGSAPQELQDDYVVTAVHYGATKGPVPQNFYTFDEEAFRVHVLPQFCRYLSATAGKFECYILNSLVTNDE